MSIAVLNQSSSSESEMAKDSFRVGASFSEINHTIQDIFKETIPHLTLFIPGTFSKILNMRCVSFEILLVPAVILPTELLIKKTNEFSKSIDERFGISKKIPCPKVITEATFFLGELHSSLSLIAEPLGIQSSSEQIAFSIVAGLSGLKLGGYSYPAIEYEIALNSMQLASSAIGSHRAMREGTSRLLETLNPKLLNTRQKIVKAVSGILLTVIGIWALGSTAKTAFHFRENIGLFHHLGFSQKEGVLKHNALHTLHEKKTCNAVIIDGDSSEWGSDDASMPFNELLYRHCDTRYYRTPQAYLLGRSLLDASEHFQSKIDVLSLSGHSSHSGMILGGSGPSDYFYWHPLRNEVESLNNTLSDSAQVFLNGCNTATIVDDYPSVAQLLSSQLPGREVIGFSAFLHLFFTTVSYDNNRFEINNYVPARETKDGWEFTSVPNAVSYVNAQIVD